jgi:hypothetical protein
MFEFLIRALKRVPRPLVPMLVMLLGPTALLLLIVYSIHA